MEMPVLAEYISKILRTVKKGGDRALLRYSAEFDRVKMPVSELRVKESEIAKSSSSLPAELKKAIVKSASNIRRFHESELKNIRLAWNIRKDGIVAGQVVRPVQKRGYLCPGWEIFISFYGAYDSYTRQSCRCQKYCNGNASRQNYPSPAFRGKNSGSGQYLQGRRAMVHCGSRFWHGNCGSSGYDNWAGKQIHQ